jgi:hypothetical protein
MKVQSQFNLNLRNKEICVVNCKLRSSLYLDYIKPEERLLSMIKTSQISNNLHLIFFLIVWLDKLI